MPHQYWCNACSALSGRYDRRVDAESEQIRHRSAAHGGLAPAAGDGIRAVHDETRGDGCLPSGSLLFFAFLLAALLANCWGR